MSNNTSNKRNKSKNEKSTGISKSKKKSKSSTATTKQYQVSNSDRLDPNDRDFAYDMFDELHYGKCEISFVKADGSKRTMICTRSYSSGLPKNETVADCMIGMEIAIPVWDLEKKAWRSVVPSSVTAFKML